MHDEPLTIDSISERQREVLRIVIQEFVQTAQPVGSAGIVGRHDLGVSPATIRNDLAALERMGLLTHPHTSAGRVPTDLGYRFFVHYLLASLDLAPEEQMAIRRQFHYALPEVDQWLRTSTAVLAKTVLSAAVATAPRAIALHLQAHGIGAYSGNKGAAGAGAAGRRRQATVTRRQPADRAR
jgi:heat-inducible transcriptional repressor